MIVNLPGNRRIAVDAKVPLQAFLDAVDTGEDRKRKEPRPWQRMAELVRGHMNQLAERKYWEQVGPELELVVLFLPGESFFSAALEQDRQLIDDGMQKKVVLATPTTLIALLRSAAYLWQQEKITQNAKEISDLGREVYERLENFPRPLPDCRNFNGTRGGVLQQSRGLDGKPRIGVGAEVQRTGCGGRR